MGRRQSRELRIWIVGGVAWVALVCLYGYSFNAEYWYSAVDTHHESEPGKLLFLTSLPLLAGAVRLLIGRVTAPAA